MSELAKRIAELTPEKRKLLAQKLQKKLLSQQLQGDEVALAQKDQILPQQREGNVFPLSFAQRRLWFLQQLEPQSAFYNMPAALRLAGRLCVDALERSLTTIVQRHEVLRTTFPTQQEQPVQVVAPSLPIYIRVIDLHGISADRLDSQINALAHAEAQCPFDLANGPLLRVYLLRLGQQTPVVTVPRARPATLPTPLATWEHVLLLTFHHIVSDGWSTGIFVREIAALYQAQINGEDGSKAASHVLPALPIQYADYTLWQRAWLQGQVMESQLAYWRKQLADAPALLELPTDWSRPAVQSYAGAQQSLLVSPELLEQLKSLSQREGVTLFMMLLAAFQVLLMRYSGQQDIVVGTPIANRTREELEGLIGFFVNTLVLRTDLSGNLSFLQLLARVREVALQAYAHQDVPFEKLVEELKPERDLSRQPLFQVLFSLDNAPLPSFELAGLSFRSMSVESQTAKFDLSLMLNEEDTGLHTVVEYNTDLFEDATMTRLLEHWQVLLETIVHHPEQNIETLPLLTEADREQLLMQWNTTSYDATSAQTDAAQDLCLHQLFERQVEQTPDAVAVVFEEQQVSYQQLNDQANHLAYRLREIGIGPDCLVGVCMERSLELLVGLLAVLKAGGAYVPLDPAYPQDRLAFLLEDAQVPVVLTQTQLYDRLTPFGIETICVEASPGHPQGMSLQWDGSACDARSSHCRGIPCGWTGVQPENLAYVIYTSGSTGKPKGVMVTHANVTRLFAITNDRFHFQSQDTWTFFHSSTFDFSVWEIWGSLLYGSRLVVVPYWQSRSPTEFYHLLVTEQVTILNQTPSAFGQLIQADLASVERMDLALRLVIFGGEALDCRRLRPWFADHADQHPQLVNMYGITETTVHVTYYPITQTDVQVHRGSIIGGPLPAVQCYVLDAHQQLVPPGIAGELYIGGVGLARGYWQNAPLTAERFVPHPFAGAIARASVQPGARLYRTGDLVRYLPTGRLEYLGRIDSQVKLRGFRIELGEVEATLQAHPAVKEAVVVLREEDEARKALAAYVVAQAGESLTLEQVRKYLREQLPDYMVPSYVVFLEALPLTLNGKVDRKALPPPVLVRHESTFELPRKPAEHTLVDIWQQVLGLSQVGVHDNFFALGGDSILSMQIIGRARQAGLQLTTKQLFQHQTIAQLAMVAQPLEQQSERVKMIGSGLCLEPPPGGFSPADFPLARLDQVTLDRLLAEREHLIEDIYPLTPLQQGLLFHTLSEPRSGVYIEQVSYTLRGEVEVGAFKRAWQQVIARHMILRTAFVWQEVSEPLQIVFKQVKLPLSILDWRNLPPEQQEADLAAFLQADRAEGFDVGQAPLMRLTLVWLSKTRTQVIWTHHHLLLDGWSISLLAQEVLACYEAAIQGQRLADAEPRPYRDYISWLAEQKNETAELYWRQVLAGIVAPTPLGVDRREREVQAARVYAEEVLQVDAATTANCQRYASREHVTVSTLVQAAWALVLARYSGQTDVIFGMVVAGRPPELAGIERMIGLFINTVPVRVQMNGEEEAGVWLARLQEQQIEQRSYEYSSLVQVQGWSEIPRAHPLFESLLAFENYPVPVTLSAEGKHVDVATKLAPVEGVHVIEHTNYPLTIVVAPAAKSEPGASMGLLASYDRQRFERATIQRLLGHLQNCLQQLVADPQQRLATISLLTKAEREQSLVQWNATRTDYPRQVCVHQLFEQRARQTPDCVALVFEDEALTYAELNRRANQLAHYLHSVVYGQAGIGAELAQRTHKGLPLQWNECASQADPSIIGASPCGCPELLVGICMERSIEMVVGILGVLKAGGAYVPLDPAYPAERLTFMIQDTQVALLLTQEHLRGRLPVIDAQLLCLDSNWSLIAQQSAENLHGPVEAENLAYVIYTSGSTGQPKGVLNKHRSLVNLCFALRTFFAHPEVRHVSLLTSISFDISVNQIFPTLAFGKTLYIIAEEIKLDALQFLTFMQERMLHLLDCVPSYLDHLLTTLSGRSMANEVAYILVGGEKLERSLLQQTFTQLGPGTVVVNIYGLTEIDDISTLLPISVHQLAQPITIGHPIQNTQVYILDAFYNPLPVGVMGELFIAGEGLSRGYLKQPARTAEKFVPNPFEPGKLMCRTGDLAKWLADGQIELLGRIDHQIKLHGFRIEIGEIEATLQAHPAVQEAAVILREEGQDRDEALSLQPLSAKKYLIAYVVPAAASREAGSRGVAPGGVSGVFPDLSSPPTPEVGAQKNLPLKEQESWAEATSALQGYLREQLPEYMVPTHIVFLEALPLTANGKVDRKALPVPTTLGRNELTFVAAREPVERTLAAIWEQVLGVRTQVGLHDNFFALGGDSILSMLIVARARQAGLRKLTLKQLFQYPTIAELATVAGPLEEAYELSGEQAEVTGPVPLTPIQHWFFEQDLLQPQHFNQSVMLQVPASWKLQPLQQILDSLLIRHDVLRLRYEHTETGWQQRLVSVAEAGSVTIERLDLTQIAASQHAERIADRANRIQASLDVQLGPLLRVVLFELGNGKPARLLIVIHHLAIDGVSWRVLLEDLQLAMAQLQRDEPIALPAKTVSFQRWAEHLQELAQSAPLQKERAYWLRVAQVSTVSLPRDFSVGSNTWDWARTVNITLTKEETRLLLQEAPLPYRSHIQELLLVALVQTLTRWMGTQSIRLDMEGHGREELLDEMLDVSRTVGWFTSLYPVVFILQQNGGMEPSDRLSQQRRWIKTIKEQLRSVPHKGVGYGLLRYLSDDPELREQLASALPSEVSFNYLGQFDQSLMSTSETSQTIQTASESSGAASGLQNSRCYLLDMNALVVGEQLHVQWTYSEQIHRQATIEARAQEFLQALRDLLVHCLEPGAGGLTPSDFPLACLDQATLDRLLAGRDGLIEDLYPLTPLQQGLLFHTLSAPQSGVYIEQVSCTLRGELAVDAFEQAWQQVIMRHAVLRTGFVWQELHEPLQIVFRQVEWSLHVLDWKGRSLQQQEADLETFLRADRNQGFALDQPPLMRLTLVQLSETRTQVIWTHHHLLLDGWSLSLLLQDVLALYTAAVQGEVTVCELRRQYRDYISWLVAHKGETAETYWRQTMAGITAPTPLGIDQSVREHGSDEIYAKETLQVAAATSARWQEYAKREHVTLNTLMQAAWALVLSRYSGQNDVLFGNVVAGRPPELVGAERMIGLFINTVPVRVQVQDEEEVGVWLRRLQTQQLEQWFYENSSLVQVQGWSEVPRDQELFESLFVFENYPVQAALTEQKGLFEVEGFQIVERTNYPLTIGVEPGTGRDQHGEHLLAPQPLHLEVSYDCRRFTRATMQRLLRHLDTVLQQLVADPQQQLATISLHTEREREQLLVQWNATDSPIAADLCLHQLFEQQVEQTPDAIAIVFEETVLTYRELNRQANQLAHRLLGEGVSPDVLVGVCMEHSLELVIALLAILKAGGAYVSLDPELLPQERLTFLLEDAQVSLILTQTHVRERLPRVAVKMISVVATSGGQDPCAASTVPQQGSPSEHWHADNLNCSVQPENLAYLIYTSGSTGRPKGVMVTHRSISNNMHWRQSVFQFKPGDSIVQRTPLSFDVSVGEIFFPLTTGARVIMAHPEGHKDSTYLLKLAAEQQATLLNLVPSLLQVCVEEPGLEQCLSLRHMLCGAEAFPAELQERFFACNHAELCNMYGPTEATIEVTRWICERENTESTVPIGRPIANTQIYLLDIHLQPVPIGVKGEIYIGGLALARGYVNRADLTAERFVPNPWSILPGERLYRTGDLARYRSDGAIEYLGRIDQQVKLRGHRIELGEIEAVLLQHPAVDEAAVLVQGERPEDKRLTAYLVLQPEQEKVELWPSVGEYPVYDEHIYSEMTHNDARNALYKAALAQTVAGKIVVDVGTGRNAILARLCVEAGAKRVYAIEMMEESYQQAQAWVNRLGMQEQIKVLHGDATQVQIPELAEVCVSEIFGAIGGAEGSGVILNNIGHLLTPQAVVVPRRSLTKIVAVRLPDELQERPAFTEVSSQYVSQVFAQVGAPFDLRLCIMNFPLSHLISDGEIFEDLHYTGQAEVEYNRQVRLTITQRTRLDGFLLWLILDLAPGQTLDILQGRYSWLPVYFPVFSPGIEVDEGDVIEMLCQGMLSDNGINPNYRLHGRVARQNRETVTFTWLSCHHQPAYKQTDFYQRLFAEDSIRIRPQQGQALKNIQEHIRAYLPEFMEPSSFVLLERWPRLPNGKLDRRALTTIGQKRQELPASDCAPRTPIEEVLVTIWMQILKLKQVGVHENFFALGGHSLLATRLMARVRAAFSIEMPLRAVFNAPTIAGLALQVEQALRKGEVIQIPPLVPMVRPEHIPLSFAQERLWFLDQLEPESTAYLIPSAYRLLGEVPNIECLDQSLLEIIQRHESLRTTFSEREGQPVQVIHPVSGSTLLVIDLQGLGSEHREQQSLELARQEARHPCDLAKGPLLRGAVLRLESHEHVLLLTLHHIVSDGWSDEVLMNELIQLYQANVSGQPSALSPLSVQYADYALWQRSWLQGEVLQAQLAYWRKQLAELSLLPLPTDYPRPAVKTDRGATQESQISGEVVQGLRRLCRQENVTLFMTLLAAFQVLLARYSGEVNIAVGTPIANRNFAEIEGLIGFFVNTLVMRTDLAGNPTFLEILLSVREVCLQAYVHQDIPFEKVVEELAPVRDMSRSPLFQVMFVMQNMIGERRSIQGADPVRMKVVPLSVEGTTSKFDLTLSMTETEQGLHCDLEYSTDLFEQAFVTRLLDHFQTFLEGIVQDPQAHLSDLPLLDEEESKQQLVEWNATHADYGQDMCLHQLISQQVEQTPEAVALVFEEAVLTYGQLNAQANHLASLLQSIGVGPDMLVGVYLQRSFDLVIGLLAILKAGAAFVPFDPSTPSERLAFLLSDTQPVMVLTQTHLKRTLPLIQGHILCLDGLWQARSRHESSLNPTSEVTPQHLAYVLYTSGSTGKPKGVMNSHQGICNTLLWKQQTYQLTPTDCLLQKTALSFDMSLEELFWPLLAGARLILAPAEWSQSSSYLVPLIAREAVTVLDIVPSVLETFLQEPDWSDCQSLHLVMSGGEALSPSLQKRFLASHKALLYNLYGPTEAAINAAYWPCEPEHDRASGASVPIGHPIANTQIYLLDRHLQPVPIGVPAEICISGINLAWGYHQHADLTAECFVPHPFVERSTKFYRGSPQPGARLYRTGDLARYRADGSIEYLGRLDSQIKLRGQRIELGEIEAVLLHHPEIREVVVLIREDERREKHLVAYVVGEQANAEMAGELRSYMQEQLPSSMVPAFFVFLDALPLISNGKVDRKALPVPDRSQFLKHTEMTPGATALGRPQTPLQEQLALIWAELLQVQEIGIHDNFFALGGHSLLAVQLLNRMNKQFGSSRLSLTKLFQAPTIEQAAALLQKEVGGLPARASQMTPWVPIQQAGAKTPFFCVHDGTGDVYWSLHLAKHLRHDRPFYGIQARGLSADQDLFYSIEEMAAYYTDELLKIQPDGPYFLGGYSFGGHVAFEMAQQLQAQGSSVALLAILDSYPREQDVSTPAEASPTSMKPQETVEDYAKAIVRIAEALSGSWKKKVLLPYEELSRLQPDAQLAYLLERLRDAGIASDDMDVSQLRRYIQVNEALGYCFERYRPKPYPGRITLFRSEDVAADPLSWSPFSAGPVEVHPVSGDHLSMVEEPHVQALALQLQQCLDKAEVL